MPTYVPCLECLEERRAPAGLEGATAQQLETETVLLAQRISPPQALLPVSLTLPGAAHPDPDIADALAQELPQRELERLQMPEQDGEPREIGPDQLEFLDEDFLDAQAKPA